MTATLKRWFYFTVEEYRFHQVFTLFIIMLLLMLVSCKDTPYMNGESIDVSSYQALEQYWLLPDDAQAQPGLFVIDDIGCREITSNLKAENNKPDAFIEIEFLIDSNGQRFAENIIDHSDDEFTQELIHFMKHTEEQLAPFGAYNFIAAANNAEHTPVFVTETLTIKSGTDSCKVFN